MAKIGREVTIRLAMRSDFASVMRLIGRGFLGCFMLAPRSRETASHIFVNGDMESPSRGRGFQAIVQVLSLGRLIILRLMRQTNVVDFFAPSPRR